MSTVNIYKLLSRKYPPNEYALMTEVSDAAGFNRSNSADYIAVALWPSRGLAVTGIELKRSRGDWLRELKKPDKAEKIFRYCDYFYLLTTDESIVKLEEIPDPWGWLNIKGDRIKIMKLAPKLTPNALSKNFVCAMLKRAADKTSFVHRDTIQEEITAARQQSESYAQRDLERLKNELGALKAKIAEFEKSAGVQFGTWGRYKPSSIGEAVKFLENGGLEGIKNDLLFSKSQAEKVVKYIEGLLT